MSWQKDILKGKVSEKHRKTVLDQAQLELDRNKRHGRRYWMAATVPALAGLFAFIVYWRSDQSGRVAEQELQASIDIPLLEVDHDILDNLDWLEDYELLVENEEIDSWLNS